MKKFLLVILILFLCFGGYVVYDQYIGKKIPVLDIEEEVISIDKLYIYGTHLNIEGSNLPEDGYDLVLYNGEFISVSINQEGNSFNLSDYVNDGYYLDNIPRGNYFLFLRKKIANDGEEESYKYYALLNNTGYDETTYYTFSKYDNKIVINSEESYPTMMVNVSENKDEEVYDVVIDPGHGGMDGGASKNDYTEAELTMEIALKLKDSLEDKGFSVKLTREDGEYSKNETMPEYGSGGRAVIGGEVHAKYLFSCHMNSNYYSSVNGLEVYTAKDINYDFAKDLVKNIVDNVGIDYSTNKINKMFDGIYTKNFTEEDVQNSLDGYEEDELVAYEVTTNSNYYYMIRETGGIVTGAYVDDRNSEIPGNPFVKTNVGIETYLLELGYISNQNDLNNMLKNMDKYILGISNSFTNYIDSLNSISE